VTIEHDRPAAMGGVGSAPKTVAGMLMGDQYWIATDT
jgi:hypothetical protein